MKRIFESVVRRCTKYLQAMTSRQALAMMFMCASITHCQGKITQRALALWHLHSWHLDVPPKACNSRREIQGPKGPVLFCQSNGETIGNNSALKKLAERIYTATKKSTSRACNSRWEIQGPKGPVVFCQSNGETIGNNSALKKLVERIYTATKKEYDYYIISRSSRNSHHQN